MAEKLLIELSSPGRRGVALPELDVPESELPPAEFLRDDLPLPEVSEVDVVRHFTRLSQLNYCVDTGFYPLGSCTMKYNPKVNERVAAFPGFNAIHPLQPVETVQGAMQLMYELQEALATITGMDGVTLQPVAGAHGELTGMLMVRAYHRARGDTKRTKVLVPASAHGTNPATAAMCGFEVISLQGDSDGNLDLDQLRRVLSDEVAGLMLTMPTTLGLFDPNILEICRLVHAAGAQVYGDGANMNALMGQARPGDLGFDVIHLNLHKTFTGPHGSGGPGSGPVLCKAHLAPFRPSPVVAGDVDSAGKATYRFEAPERTIGRVRAFYGNFGVLVRAYAYIRSLGPEGTREVGENAVLNANYVRARLKDVYRLPYDRTCMHEVVFSGRWQRARGVRTLDIAKRLIDFGYHPPTIYFPLVVDEALMIEPTETESIETLDSFIEAMREIDRESREDPDLVRSAPTTAKFGRFDETRAARQPNLRWKHAEA